MLDATLKQAIQSAYSQFLTSRGLKARAAQKQMIAEVARTLAGIGVGEQGERLGERHVSVVEAGTGTGKTIAYLLATLPIARVRKKRIVLSTATVSLQEQLVNKDLPEVIRHAGLEIRYQLAKGRGRYLCVNKIEQHLERQGELGQMALYEDEYAEVLDAQTLATYRELMDRFVSGGWDGDRDNLPDSLEEGLWRPLTSDHMQCSNRRCLNFSACPFYRARDQLDSVELVVANHDLVLADLALGGGAILPDPKDTIYVLDEGHHLPDKASGHFAFSMRLGSSQKLCQSLPKRLHGLLDEAGTAVALLDPIERIANPLREMGEVLSQLEPQIQVLLDSEERGQRVRFSRGLIPEPLRILCRDLTHASERVQQHMEQLVSVLREAMEGDIAEIDRALAERWYPQLGVLWGRVQQISWLARSYATPDPEGRMPTARWLSRIEQEQLTDVELRSAPVSAADTLREHLWEVCFGAVVTSATLTALGRFDRLLDQLGLPVDTSCVRLQSPFDHYAMGTLEVPAMRSDPGDQQAHTEEIAEYLAEQLGGIQAALVLFSSWRQMLATLERQPESIKNRILAQGDHSRQEILRIHRERIDAGQPSVIFGLASFAEGVDLPGGYLTDVIITKLPFGVPDDPVDATMAEWIEQQGGNAFSDWAVPAASMRLTQAVGRLLRTEQDRGRVVLLDRRVVTRRYGRLLLDSLPPFRRQIDNRQL
ncbi:ATP-dependent DNA helicase DinG [Marinobacterium zhoushanense]|uniref:ATP-dependent DNA helicase DinG n=1 Tax=Marinobacterium zhoushanense TaxID=1679163 RepID=A0ABQ1K8L7_9GAMM|nr:ATP-dependent DNA helicase DinG [Marinobacterium zhoushanense]GGB90226.1 ATP-dependent DNA helicase DinG [Marinobacterium zhoushanense]